jgi:ACS family tartrate transporter-like MFS transporter
VFAVTSPQSQFGSVSLEIFCGVRERSPMADLETAPVPEIERRYLNKILTRLIPFLAILYVFCLLDRGNVSIAALTMQKELRFSDTIYGAGAGIFFLGYFLFEVPSNLIMERVGARLWIARIMLTWGIVSTAMMFVHSPMSFYILRFLLGIAEAGFYPGILLYFTYWVPANARARVISRFLALTAVLGLFGGPLGGLLLQLDGRHGIAGWQWLFLLEGIPSMVLSLAVLKFLPDTPAKATWLTVEEKAWLADRVAQDGRGADRVQHMTWRVALSEPRILYLCLIFVLSATAGNAVSFFGPQLIKSRSDGAWSNSFVATIGIIPALAGAIAMILAARHSDRTGRRRYHVVAGYAFAGFGFLLCVYAPAASLVVFALAVNAIGERIGAGSYWAVTTNLMGARAAAGGLAFINSVGNLGGFLGPVLMGELKRRSNGGYEAGLYMAAGLMVAAAFLAFLAFRPDRRVATAE